MTYFQQPSPTHDDDNDADAHEASSLLLPVAGGGGEAPATKKKHGLPMRAVVATCVLLGTLAVLSSPLRRGSNRHNDTHLTGDKFAAALFLDNIQAATPGVYDPKQDYCFADTDNPGKYCWYFMDCIPYPGSPQWKGVSGHGYNNCGKQCTDFHLCDCKIGFALL